MTTGKEEPQVCFLFSSKQEQETMIYLISLHFKLFPEDHVIENEIAQLHFSQDQVNNVQNHHIQ